MKKIFLSTLIFLSSIGLYAESALQLEKSSVPIKLKNRVWSLEIAGIRSLQKATDQNINAYSGKFSLGFGQIRERFFFLTDVNVYWGPFGLNYGTVKYDYQGFGFDFMFGSALFSQTIRGEKPSMGLMGGLSYQELNGRFYRRNDIDETVGTSNDGKITSFSSRLTEADLSIGIFWASIKDRREDNTEAENLLTRNEGYMLSFYTSLPLWSRYVAKYDRLDATNQEVAKNERGDVEGLRFTLSFRVFLGT